MWALVEAWRKVFLFSLHKWFKLWDFHLEVKENTYFRNNRKVPDLEPLTFLKKKKPLTISRSHSEKKHIWAMNKIWSCCLTSCQSWKHPLNRREGSLKPAPSHLPPPPGRSAEAPEAQYQKHPFPVDPHHKMQMHVGEEAPKLKKIGSWRWIPSDGLKCGRKWMGD